MPTFSDALNAQLASEFGASQQYIAVAVWYDAQTLPLLARHFYRQAVEERNHAMIIVRYLLDARATVVIPSVGAPRTDFDDPVAPVRLALAQEEQVTQQISELAKLARAEGDLVGEQFLAGSCASSSKRCPRWLTCCGPSSGRPRRTSSWRRTTSPGRRSAIRASRRTPRRRRAGRCNDPSSGRPTRRSVDRRAEGAGLRIAATGSFASCGGRTAPHVRRAAWR